MMKNQDLPDRLSKVDQETVRQIKKSLKDFDDMISIEVPPASFFEQKIKLQREKNRKEWWKELLVFIGIAAFILSLLLVSLFHQPEVFLTIQVLSVIFIGSYTFYMIRKVESSHE